MEPSRRFCNVPRRRKSSAESHFFHRGYLGEHRVLETSATRSTARVSLQHGRAGVPCIFIVFISLKRAAKLDRSLRTPVALRHGHLLGHAMAAWSSRS